MVVIINALFGFIQEGKAEHALDAIKGMLSHSANVQRDGGSHRTIPAEQLVPGDVVNLASGDQVPADPRLFQVKELNINEATLTGESAPASNARRILVGDPVAITMVIYVFFMFI